MTTPGPSVARPLAAAVGRASGSYRTAHRRVRAARGTPSDHRCASCGGLAVVWCYDGTDPTELADQRGRRYSPDPARYRPLCRFCRRRDVVERSASLSPVWHRPELDVERAERLYRAGASSRGIAALMGVSRGVVLRALRARAVPIRPPVAPPRRVRRYPVTPRPHPTASPHRDHDEDDTTSRHPIFQEQISTTSTRTSTTTDRSLHAYDQEQQQDPREPERTNASAIPRWVPRALRARGAWSARSTRAE